MKQLLVFAGRHRAIVIGLIAQVLQYGASLLLLPFIVTRLPTAEVGIWYIFVTVQGLAALADFGFQPTIARSFAAAYAGADRLHRQGLGANEEVTQPNLALVARVLRTSRRLYLMVSLAVLLILLTFGTWYISTIAGRQIDNVRYIQISWIVYATGAAFNLYLLWVSPLLLGANRPSHNYLYLIASRGGFAILGVLALISGGGLLALALMNVCGGMVGRLVAGWSMRPIMRELAAVPKSESYASVLGDIGPNAGRMGLVALGGFLINRFSVLILSAYVGLGSSASYAISLQLLTALTAASLLPSQIALPHMVSMRVRHATGSLRRLFVSRHLFMLAVFVAGATFMILLGQQLLSLIGSHVVLLSRPLLIMLSIVMLLEANHTNCAFVITTGNRVPFVASALLSGIGVAVLGVFLASRLEIFGVILAQGIVQIAYNNWKWPSMLWAELRS